MNRLRTSTITITIIGALGAFLLAATVLADDGDTRDFPESPGNDMEIAGDAKSGLYATHSGRHWRVRCDRGQSLSKALFRARAQDTIRIYGTCYESIVIKTDHLTVRGVNGATIDGSQAPSEAVVLIDGARGISLEDFTVQNGSDQGILATHQAQGVLSGLNALNNGTVGLSVDRSHLEIVDLTLDNNGTGGMDAYSGSTVVARGILSANDNDGDGLAANGKTFFELRGAQVTASRNSGSGVSIINDSRLQIFSFPEAQGSSVNADSNGFAGIAILGAEVGVVGSQYFGSGANILSAKNNAVFGFFAPAGSIISPHATAKFIAQGNGVGMLMEDGASVVIVGGLDLSENGAGLSAHGAGTLTIVSVPPNPSRINENGIDIDLGFGTRLTADQVEFTSMSCDSTVLTRGASCP